MDATTTTPLGLRPSRRHGRRQRAAGAAAGAVRSLAYRFLEPLLCELRLLLAPRPLYGPVKATMLADGHAVAAGLVVAAVLGNHVRRVLAPWLGQFLWWHPVQAMRLARGTPHFFIEQQVLQSSSAAAAATDDAATLGFWALQTIALAATKALLRHRLLADATITTTTTITTSATGLTNPKSRGGKGVAGGGRSSSSSSSSSSTGPRAAAMRATTSSMACLTDCYRIIYLTLCIMHVEYAYAEACWAASWIHAATHVALRGTTAEKLFTHRLLTGHHHHHHHHHDQQPARTESDGGAMAAHWRGLSLIAGLLAWWSWRHVLRPLRRHGVVVWAFSGLPVLGGLIGAGTAHIIKYSNKYFIWLEMSEMLLTWAWLLLGLALVAAWRLCDGQDAE
ncbi:hypothetical protein BBO_01155 [Beauveria brongniartii RCEF 3172]|uniref:Uncharacterized protein n=1 Tax=Beauveria brongniartii RCEF 3172 TaxID=1081107 RepID=A0A162JZG3_9HYPO|nr:hypothetical protein BBO_01155 [Beauveria brongniartii RCEF 3172]